MAPVFEHAWKTEHGVDNSQLVTVSSIVEVFRVTMDIVVIVIVVYCEELSSPSDGIKLGNETVVFSQVLFGCNHCFELKGHSNLTCRDNGQWSADQPTCEC